MYMYMCGYIAYYTRYISSLREGPHSLDSGAVVGAASGLVSIAHSVHRGAGAQHSRMELERAQRSAKTADTLGI